MGGLKVEAPTGLRKLALNYALRIQSLGKRNINKLEYWGKVI